MKTGTFESNTTAESWRECVSALSEAKRGPTRAKVSIETETERRVAAILIISVICYPDNPRLRAKFISALLALNFKLERDTHENYIPGTELFRRDMQSKTVRRILEKTSRQLIKRLKVTVEIAAPVSGMRLGFGDGPSSITKAIAESSGSNGIDEANFRQRMWKPTVPVLHLALGLLASTEDCAAFGEDPDLLELMLVEGPRWVPTAISWSNFFLELLVSAKIVKDIRSVHVFST